MSVRFNTHGTQVLALRRRLPPILYNTHCEDSICQFYHADYFNSCTMKSCSFAGDNDEYVISGSDDFNLYMWRVTDANSEFNGLATMQHSHFVKYIDDCVCVCSYFVRIQNSKQEKSMDRFASYGFVRSSFDCQSSTL